MVYINSEYRSRVYFLAVVTQIYTCNRKQTKQVKSYRVVLLCQCKALKPHKTFHIQRIYYSASL